MKEDLKIAADVHYSFLPEYYADERLEVATCSIPNAVLGGDYCSVIPLGENRFAACICDAVGHGVASALYAARINTFVLASVLQGRKPCDLIDSLNAFLCNKLSISGMYASFFVVFLDFDAMEMHYAGAGHPASLHYVPGDHHAHLLESQTSLLGVDHPLLVECPMEQRKISSGDRILLYTDGLTEARNHAAEEFGSPGIIEYVMAHDQENSRDMADGLCAKVYEHCNGKIHDDMLCMSMLVK